MLTVHAIRDAADELSIGLDLPMPEVFRSSVQAAPDEVAEEDEDEDEDGEEADGPDEGGQGGGPGAHV